MHEIHLFETNINHVVQLIRSPFIDNIFMILNIFDSNFTYLVIIIFVWNFVNKRAGFHLLYLEVIGGIINTDLKFLFAQPRPYDLLYSLKVIRAVGYGLPSGAATAATICFGYLFMMINPKYTALRIVAVTMIGVVGLTRIYLGAHFLTDILGGYLVGIAILLGYVFLVDKVEKYIKVESPCNQFFFHTALISLFYALTIYRHSLHLLYLLYGAIVFHVFREPRFDNSHSVKTANPWLKSASSVLGVLGVMALFLSGDAISNYVGGSYALGISAFAAFLAGIWIGVSHLVVNAFYNLVKAVVKKNDFLS